MVKKIHIFEIAERCVDILTEEEIECVVDILEKTASHIEDVRIKMEIHMDVYKAYKK